MRRPLFVLYAVVVAAAAGCAALLGVDDVGYSADAGAPSDVRVGGDADAGADAGGDANFDGAPDPELCPDDEPVDGGPDDAGTTMICDDASTVVVSNSKHCGACGHACTPLRCSGTQCDQEFVTSAGGGAHLVAADDASVVWFEQGLFRTFPPDAASSPLFVPDAGFVRAAAVGSNEVWLVVDAKLFAMDLNDGGVRQAYSDPDGVGPIALDDSSVYFYLPGNTPPSSSVVASMSRDGGTLTPIAPGVVSEIAADSRGQAWIVPPVPGDGGAAGSIQLRNAAGELATAISASNPGALALTPRYVYWVDEGVLYRARRVHDPRAIRTGASSEAPLGPNYGLAIDQAYVYWRNGVNSGGIFGTIFRTPRCGGPTRIEAQVNAGGAGPVTGGGFVYWNQVNGPTGINRTR